MSQWGGFRPGAGRKPKPKTSAPLTEEARHRRSQERTPGPVIIPAGSSVPSPASRPALRARPKVPAVAGQAGKVRELANVVSDFTNSKKIIEALFAVSRRKTGRKVFVPTAENNPFRLPEFPPAAIPKGEAGRAMAMDEFPATNWASAAWLGGTNVYGAAMEGLLFPGYQALAQMSQRPEYRTISEIISTETTRKWIKFSTTAGKMQDGKVDKTAQKSKLDRIRELETFLDDLGIRQRYEEMAMQDGLMGRAHLGHLFSKPGETKVAANITDMDPSELAIPIGTGRRGDSMSGKVEKGMRMRLQSVEAMWAYPQQYNATQPLGGDFFAPQFWYVNGLRIHASRLRTFVGKPVPDILKPAYAFGGLSMTQIAMPYVDIWLQTRESVAAMIHSFSVMILMTDLSTLLQPGGSELLAQRIDAFNNLRDNQGLMVGNNGKEDLKNVSAPLGGLHELQAQSQEHMFSVSRIPAVKFAGIQPAGLNASSEGEIRVWYDTVKAFQQFFFRPNLTCTIDFAQRCLWGEPDPDIVFEFVDLHEDTPKEKGEARKGDADAAAVYIDRGVISPAEERARLASDPNGVYQGIDPDEVPEPPADPNVDGEEDGGGEGGEGGEGGPDNDNDKKEPPKKAANDEAMVAEMGRRVLPFAGDEWVEADHPRDPEGKFSSGGGGGGAHASDPPAGSKGAQSLQKASFLQSFTNPVDGLTAHIHKAAGGKFHVNMYDIDSGELAGAAAANTIEEAKSKATEFLGEWQKVHGEQKVAAAIKKTFSKTTLPQSSDLKKIGEQKGSNPGGVYEDFEGNKYYIKQPKSKAHVRNELTAAALYNLAGAPTLKYVPVQGGGEVATQIKQLAANKISQMSGLEHDNAKKDFAVHAWLANWDAAGTGGDNQGVDMEGKPITLDVGGALNYRAQGEPKGDLFGANVPEFLAMRQSSVSPDSAALFGDMTTAELTESVEKVTSISDQEIRDVVEGMGGNADLADKLIARKDDLAKQLGAINPQWEADHPRGPDGRYIKKLGGEEPAAPVEAEKQEEPSAGAANAYTPEEFKKAYGGIKSPHVKESYYATVASVKAGSAPAGSNYRRLLQKLLNDANAHGMSNADRAIIMDRMVLSLGKTRQNLAAAGKFDEADKVLKKMEDFGYKWGDPLPDGSNAMPVTPLPATAEPKPAPAPKPKAEPKKVEIKEEPKPAPAPEPEKKDPFAGFPEPTEAELTKAKKSVPLQEQYVPGASEIVSPNIKNVVGQLIDKFNTEWGGKEGLNDAQLKAKVNHFKALAAATKSLAEQDAAQKAKSLSEAQALQAQKNAEAAALQKAKNAKAAEALKAQQAAAKAKNEEYMKALGISETEAGGFNSLVEMHGGSGAELVQKFKHYEEEAKKHGYPISGFQYALIRDYINGGYASINPALRSPNISPQQHVYTRMVNDALEKLPKYTGTVERGANLTAKQIADYVPGQIVTEKAFTSTGIGFKFSGKSVYYKIKSIGRRGADFSQGANPGEKEVLFKAGTQFLVHSVEQKDGKTYIEMEEVEHHG